VVVKGVDATLDSDILVNILFQRFVIIVDITFVFYYVAVWSVVGRVDRNNVPLVARVLDLL
jgi:hypothetical protein